MEPTTEQEKEHVEEVTDGVFVREEKNSRNGYSYWYIKTGESSFLTEVCTVYLRHPVIETYNRDEPLTDGQITVKGLSSWNSDIPMTPAAAQGLEYALERAREANAELLEELRPKVEDKLKEIEERERQRVEHQEKRAVLLEKINKLETEWVKGMAEVLNWFEGAPGRLKRQGKRQWDIFHELQAIDEDRDYITWQWSGQFFSDRLSSVKDIQMKNEDEREYEPVEGLPDYPTEEIQKLREELSGLRYY